MCIRDRLCGGSGLYYRAITRGIFKESKTDLKIRHELENEYNKHGADDLMSQLVAVDPDYAKNVHLNNKKRLIRALEIYRSTGKPPTQHYNEQLNNPISKMLNLFTIYLEWEKSELNNRIQMRTEDMLNAGWIDEVKQLFKKYSNASIPPLDSIGYREIVSYLNDKITIVDLEELISLKTKQFSSRQTKWFKKEQIDLIIEMKRDMSPKKVCNQILDKIQIR